MTNFAYPLPEIHVPESLPKNEILLVASGDLRQSANQVCWPAQAEVERKIIEAFRKQGATVRRAHPYREDLGHGFIYSQRMGMDVFMHVPKNTPIIVAEAVWQYSHNIFSGLQNHQGPILTVANWSAQWPGLVGMLNLNACLAKANVPYSTIWSENFDDEFFLQGIREWISKGKITHDRSHIRDLQVTSLPAAERKLGIALAQELRYKKAILGIFDEGCMGMTNAIIEDSLLNPLGVYKERLSQSALAAAMKTISEAEARAARQWLDQSGLKFIFGPNPETDLTEDQVLEQCKMYIAAVRMAHEFGCDAIGIQYQQGLKDTAPASDLVEGLLNNAERPPVYGADGKELYAGQPLPHFNEVDECAGLDALITNRVWTAMQFDPATTLHDVRWGDPYKRDGREDFVWLLQISGAVPASHILGGYGKAVSERQPPMYFRLGGGTLKGVCKPGAFVWSRIFTEGGCLHADIGRGTAIELPEAETERRWKLATSQWPIMHAILHGVSRDQMMARHRANHLNVAYTPDAASADKALAAKAAMMAELGIAVHRCGI
jgi:hypothetical protein